MPQDNDITTYDSGALRAAVLDVADSPEEADDLLQWVKPTSMMSSEEQLVLLARTIRDSNRGRATVAAEIKRTNDLIDARDKLLVGFVTHLAGCVSNFLRALAQPKLLFPSLAVVAFASLFAVGQGERAMDIGESLIEHYLSVDIHGHVEATVKP